MRNQILRQSHVTISVWESNFNQQISMNKNLLKYNTSNTFLEFVAESYEGGGPDCRLGDGVLALAGAMTCDDNSGSSKSSLIPA